MTYLSIPEQLILAGVKRPSALELALQQLLIANDDRELNGEVTA